MRETRRFKTSRPDKLFTHALKALYQIKPAEVEVDEDERHIDAVFPGFPLQGRRSASGGAGRERTPWCMSGARAVWGAATWASTGGVWIAFSPPSMTGLRRSACLGSLPRTSGLRRAYASAFLLPLGGGPTFWPLSFSSDPNAATVTRYRLKPPSCCFYLSGAQLLDVRRRWGRRSRCKGLFPTAPRAARCPAPTSRCNPIGEAEADVRGAVTGQNGYYQITGVAPGAYAVRVSFVGYAAFTDTLDLGDEDVVTLSTRLAPGAEALDEVVVETESGAAEDRGRPPDASAPPTLPASPRPTPPATWRCTSRRSPASSPSATGAGSFSYGAARPRRTWC